VTIGNEANKMYGCPAARIDAWQTECFRRQLLDRDRPKSASAMFSKYRTELIAADYVVCNDTMAWTLPKKQQRTRSTVADFMKGQPIGERRRNTRANVE
jgi:hypothetical protein